MKSRPPRPTLAQLAAQAHRLLASGAVGDEPLLQQGLIGPGLPVVGPGGTQHSWLLPVTVGQRLVAFFHFNLAGTLLRFSGFYRRAGNFGNCPRSTLWLDPDDIRRRVQKTCRDGEVAGAPVLAFDRTPDRLAWEVAIISTKGGSRTVLVAGDLVFDRTPSREVG